ncbi:hypothetical protein LENED_002105 [Lentinula edodes]|uniref:Uncharacterized protein n=1 Tax=Lentinula edodes TaxID=5353 RepID=A0A1Q3E087_LENED|nr:hypothetical protein LENED_002105 [Lentinula edodes]
MTRTPRAPPFIRQRVYIFGGQDRTRTKDLDPEGMFHPDPTKSTKKTFRGHKDLIRCLPPTRAWPDALPEDGFYANRPQKHTDSSSKTLMSSIQSKGGSTPVVQHQSENITNKTLRRSPEGFSQPPTGWGTHTLAVRSGASIVRSRALSTYPGLTRAQLNTIPPISVEPNPYSPNSAPMRYYNICDIEALRVDMQKLKYDIQG